MLGAPRGRAKYESQLFIFKVKCEPNQYIELAWRVGFLGCLSGRGPFCECSLVGEPAAYTACQDRYQQDRYHQDRCRHLGK